MYYFVKALLVYRYIATRATVHSLLSRTMSFVHRKSNLCSLGNEALVAHWSALFW